jgi:hypothetical protein
MNKPDDVLSISREHWERYEGLEAENEKLREALAKYADADNWVCDGNMDLPHRPSEACRYDRWHECSMGRNGYTIAREALKEKL